MTVAEQFAAVLAECEARIAGVPEERALLPYRTGGWTRKEVLGHLIDSAINNHVRFAGAATNAEFALLFGYEERGWVVVHGYRDMVWADLLVQWRMQNQLLLRVVPHLPLAQILRVGDTAWTLEQWTLDYLSHLRHHVDQIAS